MRYHHNTTYIELVFGKVHAVLGNLQEDIIIQRTRLYNHVTCAMRRDRKEAISPSYSEMSVRLSILALASGRFLIFLALHKILLRH
jgi:hypothetical protein